MKDHARAYFPVGTYFGGNTVVTFPEHVFSHNPVDLLQKYVSFSQMTSLMASFAWKTREIFCVAYLSNGV